MKKVLVLFMMIFSASCIFGQEEKDKGKDFSNNVKSIFKKLGTEISEGVDKLTEEIETTTKRKTEVVTGKVKVKDVKGSTIITIQCTDGNIYTLKTFSGSETSMDKLTVYHNKTIKVTGMINTETMVLSIIKFELVK